MNAEVLSIGGLPDAATRALEAWRSLRGENGEVPRLSDLAPAEIPRGLLPWLMTIRRLPDGQLVYGVVGEQMVTGHAENPRGKTFLYDASPAVQATWTGHINNALDRGKPFWIVSQGVRAHHWARFGRLGLPTAAADGDALLVLFFRMKVSETPKRTAERIAWLD